MKGITEGERNPCFCSEGGTRTGVGALALCMLGLAAVRGKRAGKLALCAWEGFLGCFCHPVSLCQG